MTAQVQNFSTAPQAVGTRQKYRDPDDGMRGSGNMMTDKRIVRGNTLGSVGGSTGRGGGSDAEAVTRQREAQRRRLLRANQTRKRASGTPPAGSGKSHGGMNTDCYLEELMDRTVEYEAEGQADSLFDRPPSPLFMPVCIGVDTETQVEDGELFNFDLECEPILEVLVGKCLELGMLEVLEEAELDALRKHQEEYQRRRQAELGEVQRMENSEKRRHDEMERRLQQFQAQQQRDLSIMRKIVCRSVASTHFASLKDRALAHLLDAHVFSDSVEKGVQHEFMRSLVTSVSKLTQDRIISQNTIAEFSATVVNQRVATHDVTVNIERQRLFLVDDAERKSREEKRQEQLARDENEARVKAEQEQLQIWENVQPPPPPEPEEVVITAFDAETNEAVLSDESRVPVAPEHVEQLTELLAKDLSAEETPGQAVLGSLLTYIEGVNTAPLKAAAEAPAAEAPAAEEAPDAEAPADEAPAEAPAPEAIVDHREILDFRLGVPTAKEAPEGEALPDDADDAG